MINNQWCSSIPLSFKGPNFKASQHVVLLLRRSVAPIFGWPTARGTFGWSMIGVAFAAESLHWLIYALGCPPVSIAITYRNKLWRGNNPGYTAPIANWYAYVDVLYPLWILMISQDFVDCRSWQLLNVPWRTWTLFKNHLFGVPPLVPFRGF